MFHKTRPRALISLGLACRYMPEKWLTVAVIKLLRLQSIKLRTPVLLIHRVFLRDHCGVRQGGHSFWGCCLNALSDHERHTR